MKLTRISQGGQVQIPAEIRRRWATKNVLIDDAGAYIRIRPVPDDPIAAAAGSLAGLGKRMTGDEIARVTRDEELVADEQKLAR
jgi:hypothetical protein